MPPYLTRKRASSNSELKTRSITSEVSRVKDHAKLSSTRLITRSKTTLVNKQHDTLKKSDKDVSQEERKTTRHRRLGKDVNKKKSMQTEKVATRNKASTQDGKNPKRKKISNKVNDSVSSLRQTSLKESFTKQTKIIALRSRKIVENSKENTLIKKSLSPKSQNSIVVLNRLSAKKRKVPVYKCVSPENSPKNTTEVYEFKCDINDPKERLPKKRKRRPVVKKTMIQKKKKNILENQNVQKTEVYQNRSIDSETRKTKEENSPKSLQIHQKERVNIEFKEDKENSPPKSLQNNTLIESPVENQVEKNLQIHQEEPVNIESKDMENSLPKSLQNIILIESPVENQIEKNLQIHQEEPANIESKDMENSLPKSLQNNILIESPVENQIEKNLQIHQEEPVNIESKDMENNLPKSLQNNILIESLVENQVEENSMGNLKNTVNSNKEELSVQSVLKASESTNEARISNNIVMKPTIVSIQDLSNKRITIKDNSQTSNSKDLESLKSANAINSKLMVQHKNMVNQSLFEKSLSPIVKSSENISWSSPWRTPQLLTFSQVKNAFQSTPQGKHYEISGRRLARSSKNESRNYNNENVSIEGHANTSNLRKKNPKISRKFGTEITNLDHSVQSNLVEDTENQPPNSVQSIINPNASNASKFDNTENKENSVLNYESPKRSPRKEFKNVKVKSEDRKSETNIRSDEQKENIDPQPGPSGLQNIKVLNEQRVLRQSNLNNFLNIMEMPQSTTIKTPHGIFNDVHSTPVNRKTGMKPKESNMELKNAFGFDDDSNQDISPIEHEVTNDEKENEKVIQTHTELPNVKPFTRISLGELKNNFLPEKRVKDIRDVGNVKNKKAEVRKSPIKSKQKQIDIANFSDTFDILSEIDESAAENTSNVPLFADLEPSHFTQPPRHSYKRKRAAVKFSLSEESSEEEEEAHELKVKRKKFDKMKKEQEKRLLEWVQDINKTFDEIDKFELLVE